MSREHSLPGHLAFIGLKINVDKSNRINVQWRVSDVKVIKSISIK